MNSSTVRKCGACTACCTVMAVAELKKKNFACCCHLQERCTIYEKRPQSCRDWSCNWLLGLIDGDERRRPDKLGLIFTVELRGSSHLITAYEVWDGAVNGPPAKYILEKMQKRYPIALVYTSNRFEILTPDERQKAELTEIVRNSVIVDFEDVQL